MAQFVTSLQPSLADMSRGGHPPHPHPKHHDKEHKQQKQQQLQQQQQMLKQQQQQQQQQQKQQQQQQQHHDHHHQQQQSQNWQSSTSGNTNVPEQKSDGNTAFLRAARAGNLDKVLEHLKSDVDINTANANGLNALHLASKEGHTHVVTELLSRGAFVDASTKKGNTALHIASLAGQEEVVRLLVQHGAAVNVQSQNGFTPLYMAAQENHDNVVKFLLANGANQSLATEDGFTPLAVAMQQGHDKVVAVLLENDTRGKVRLPALHIAAKKDDCKAAALLLQNEHNPDVTSKSGFTPLHIAAHYGNEAIANLLLTKGADVNYSAKHNISPLHVAAKWGKANLVALLLERGAHIEAKTRDGLTPLHCAARSGHEQVVDMMLERGAPISCKTKNGLAPLHMAAQGDHVDGARILLYHRAPVDEITVDYLTALHVAAHCGHVRVAKLLLDRKADPNARALNGFTPLHIACKKNRIKVVELLLKHGASIEATTESGLTPLHVASFMGCMNIVIYLLQNEANPDVPTVRGETPLHLAARANQTDIIRILLRNGAQVDARAREQQSPLHIASRLGNVDIVMLLLQHGAAVDSTTKDLYTALHIAAKEGQEEVAAVLLDNGASLTATTSKGCSPLHLAAKYGNIKVARLLLQKDAPVDSQGKNGVTPLHVASHYDHQNVALLLLDKGASPHATAKNGHTPLHIAARKNQMDIATTLLEYGAKANAESRAGFTPLHLSCQEGHTDMSTLLIEHQADTNHQAKNGLTPLHLCAQEDRVNVAQILVKNGANVDSTTKAGYTPLHVASHFGQVNMVRFLVQHGASTSAVTSVGYTPLHQAAQQGHSGVVSILLNSGAQPNVTTKQGQTALSIAQKLGYISVVETLKVVTEVTTITTTTTTTIEEKYRVVAPETMQETFMSDSEEEGGEDTVLNEQPYHYLTVDEMKSLGDDSLPIDVTQDDRHDSNRDLVSPQHAKEVYATQMNYTSDNVDISRHPVNVGFLVSFLVDARGGAMRGCRHSGVRVIVPPRKAPQPLRVTCRYLKRDKLSHPPPLMEGEALASRILELGPVGAKFLGPVIIEVPHFGSLRGREREIVILRSDNGETWREHTVEASEDAIHDVLNESFEKDGERNELSQLEVCDSGRLTRILTTDFPQYFAVVSRVRQEVHAIGPEGGMVSSSVVPQVQAVFPQGALTKKIKVGLQAQPIAADLVAKLLGNRVAVSPIVTVEPRRRKFHKPITLTIPVPQAANKGMINQYSGDAPTLRLLCSITGGTTRAQWEDVTGSTPLTFVNDCVSFTTTVSARFWLMDCRNITEATKMATELYKEAIHVPFLAKFVVFAKRVDFLEARLRVFCMTDDKEDKTLEHQEHFTEVAKSRDVEVLEGKAQFVEFAGNLVPVTKSGDQLQLGFRGFRENRLAFTTRVKDPHADPVGRILFMKEAKVQKGDPPQQPVCVLNIVLPDDIIPESSTAESTPVKYSHSQSQSQSHSHSHINGTAAPARPELRLSDISNTLGSDWESLAVELGLSRSDVERVKSDHPAAAAPQHAMAMLKLWLQRLGNKASGTELQQALQRLGRDDIIHRCMITCDDQEMNLTSSHLGLDQSGFDNLRDELGVSRDDSRDASRETSLRRNLSLEAGGPYDEPDIMKDSESVEELVEKQIERIGEIKDIEKRLSREQDDSEERKYIAEEKEVEEKRKSVRERTQDIEKRLSQTSMDEQQYRRDSEQEPFQEVDESLERLNIAQPSQVEGSMEWSETKITSEQQPGSQGGADASETQPSGLEGTTAKENVLAVAGDKMTQPENLDKSKDRRSIVEDAFVKTTVTPSPKVEDTPTVEKEVDKKKDKKEREKEEKERKKREKKEKEQREKEEKERKEREKKERKEKEKREKEERQKREKEEKKNKSKNEKSEKEKMEKEKKDVVSQDPPGVVEEACVKTAKDKPQVATPLVEVDRIDRVDRVERAPRGEAADLAQRAATITDEAETLPNQTISVETRNLIENESAFESNSSAVPSALDRSGADSPRESAAGKQPLPAGTTADAANKEPAVPTSEIDSSLPAESTVNLSIDGGLPKLGGNLSAESASESAPMSLPTAVFEIVTEQSEVSTPENPVLEKEISVVIHPSSTSVVLLPEEAKDTPALALEVALTSEKVGREEITKITVDDTEPIFPEKNRVENAGKFKTDGAEETESHPFDVNKSQSDFVTLEDNKSAVVESINFVNAIEKPPNAAITVSESVSRTPGNLSDDSPSVQTKDTEIESDLQLPQTFTTFKTEKVPGEPGELPRVVNTVVEKVFSSSGVPEQVKTTITDKKFTDAGKADQVITTVTDKIFSETGEPSQIVKTTVMERLSSLDGKPTEVVKTIVTQKSAEAEESSEWAFPIVSETRHSISEVDGVRNDAGELRKSVTERVLAGPEATTVTTTITKQFVESPLLDDDFLQNAPRISVVSQQTTQITSPSPRSGSTGSQERSETTTTTTVREVSYVTTPTMQRRAHSQRRTDRPAPIDVSYIQDDDSDQDEYIVTEPTEEYAEKIEDRFRINSSPEILNLPHSTRASPDPSRVKFQLGSMDSQESFSSDPTTPVTPNAKVHKFVVQKVEEEPRAPDDGPQDKDCKLKRVERHFERMASQSLAEGTNPVREVDYQRVLSQLSQEDVAVSEDEYESLLKEQSTPSEDSQGSLGGTDESPEALEAAMLRTAEVPARAPIPTLLVSSESEDRDDPLVPTSVFWCFDDRPMRASSLSLDDLGLPLAEPSAAERTARTARTALGDGRDRAQPLPTHPLPTPRRPDTTDDDDPDSEPAIQENIKSYSERRAFWEQVSAGSTETPTDPTITMQGTLQQKATTPVQSAAPLPLPLPRHVGRTESVDSEADFLAKRGNAAGFENDAFVSDDDGTASKPLSRMRSVEGYAEAPVAVRKAIYERSISLPCSDAAPDTAKRKRQFEDHLKKELVAEKLMQQLEEEAVPEHKELPVRATSEEGADSLLSDEAFDHDAVPRPSVRDIAHAIEKSESMDCFREVAAALVEETMHNAEAIVHKAEEHVIQDPEEEIVEWHGVHGVHNLKNRFEATDADRRNLPDDQKSGTELRRESLARTHEVTSSRLAEVMQYKAENMSKPSDSLEVHVDKSETEDTEKSRDLDDDIKDLENQRRTESRVSSAGSKGRRGPGDHQSQSSSEDTQCESDVTPEDHPDQSEGHSLYQPEQHIQDIVWEVGVQDQPDPLAEEFVHDYLVPSGRMILENGVVHETHCNGMAPHITEAEARKAAEELVQEIEVEVSKRNIEVPIIDSIRQLAEEKKLEEREIELMQSILAKKQRDQGHLFSRTDTTTSSMEITDEDLRSSGVEIDLSPTESQSGLYHCMDPRARQEDEKPEALRSEDIDLSDLKPDPLQSDDVPNERIHKNFSIIEESDENDTRSDHSDIRARLESETTDEVQQSLDAVDEELEEEFVVRDVPSTPAFGFAQRIAEPVVDCSYDPSATEAAPQGSPTGSTTSSGGKRTPPPKPERKSKGSVESLRDAGEVAETVIKVDKNIDRVVEHISIRAESVESQKSSSQDDRSPMSSGETAKGDVGEIPGVVRRHQTRPDGESSSSGDRSGGGLHPDRRSGADFDPYSSSSESHYHSFEQSYSRPCSSDVEGLLAVTTGSSEYESAIASTRSVTSTEYQTAVSSLSSRESMKSLDSESSGHLASVEVSSEASETLVPSATELDEMDDSSINIAFDDDFERRMHSDLSAQDKTDTSRATTANKLPCTELSDDDADDTRDQIETDEEDEIPHIMKRSHEMTFHPEPNKALTGRSDSSVDAPEDKLASSMDGDTASVLSMSISSASETLAARTVIELSRTDSDKMDASGTSELLTASATSQEMSYSSESRDEVEEASLTPVLPKTVDSGTSTPTHQRDQTVSSVTMTTSSVEENGIQSASTQVTSEPLRRSHRRNESTSAFTPFIAPGSKAVEEVATSDYCKPMASPEAGDKKDEDDESYHTEADQAFHREAREGRYLSDDLEPELEQLDGSRPHSQVSDSESGQRAMSSGFSDERADSELAEVLRQGSSDTACEDMIERPLTPEPAEEIQIKPDVSEFSKEALASVSDIGIEYSQSHAFSRTVEYASHVSPLKDKPCVAWEHPGDHEDEIAEAVFPHHSPHHHHHHHPPMPETILEDEDAEKSELEAREAAIKEQKRRREEHMRSISPANIPDITITQHMAPIEDKDFQYPDLEADEDLGSMATNPVSQSEDSGDVREANVTESPTSEPFEMLERPEDIEEQQDVSDEFVIIEEVGREAHEFDAEGKAVRIASASIPIRRRDTDPDDEFIAQSPPPTVTRKMDVKYYGEGGVLADEGDPFHFDEGPEEGGADSEADVDAGKKWIEMQFGVEDPAAVTTAYSYEMEFERGPLEDIKEEDEMGTSSKIGSLGSQKESVGSFGSGSVKESLSSTPEYDVLAGKKYFTRSGEHDDISMSSLQEFESLEHQVALEVAHKRMIGSQDSLNGAPKKRAPGDDISLASLQEFEKMEKACVDAEHIEIRARVEEAMLSEIDEGHESQVSDSDETISGAAMKTIGDSDSDDYDRRMFEIDEIIRQAQSNVERFESPRRTGGPESFGRGDSLDEVARVPDLDFDTPISLVTSTDSLELRQRHPDSMVTSADSLEVKVSPTPQMVTSADSIELQQQLRAPTQPDIMTDSIELPTDPSHMVTSSDSLELETTLERGAEGTDEETSLAGRGSLRSGTGSLQDRSSSSGRDGDLSSSSALGACGGGRIDPAMLGSTDSLEPTSSTATHATYQYETDSNMSSSFTSGGSNTMVSSTETLEASMPYEGSSWFDETYTETLDPTADPDFQFDGTHIFPSDMTAVAGPGGFTTTPSPRETVGRVERFDSDGHRLISRTVETTHTDLTGPTGTTAFFYSSSSSQSEIPVPGAVVATTHQGLTTSHLTGSTPDAGHPVGGHAHAGHATPTVAPRRPPPCHDISVDDEPEFDVREHDWRFQQHHSAEAPEEEDSERQ